MFQFFIDGGQMMWLLLILFIITIYLTIKNFMILNGRNDPIQTHLENGINAIFFWGGISAVLGFFGHFWGVYMAMQAISEANDISPAVVAEGYAVSLITILTGLFIFLFAAIVWFILRWRLKKRIS